MLIVTHDSVLHAEDLGSMGVVRLNIGSGIHVDRDYGDTASLYVDRDAPPKGIYLRDFPQIIVVGEGLKYLVCEAPPLPFEDGAIGQVFTEHLVEHLTPRTALVLCSEFRRVLRPGGVLRMSTPDLALFAKLYQRARTGEDDGERARMLQEIAKVDPGVQDYVISDSRRWAPSAAFLLNHIFRLWGHEWIYDADELTTLLTCAGFDRAQISVRGFREGACPDLARQDLAYHQAESLYVEAVRT